MRPTLPGIAFLVDRAPGGSDSNLEMPFCFDTFRKTIRKQRDERYIPDATMPSAKTPPAMHLIGATLIEEAENCVTRRRKDGLPSSASQDGG
jgi:hypothetical protein